MSGNYDLAFHGSERSKSKLSRLERRLFLLVKMVAALGRTWNLLLSFVNS